jgi:hypothetical protein
MLFEMSFLLVLAYHDPNPKRLADSILLKMSSETSCPLLARKNLTS